MRILLLFFIVLLSNCSSVKIAKELTKVTGSIKTSVDNVINNSKNSNQDGSGDEISSDKKIINEVIANLEKEKNEKKKIINAQKKVNTKFLGRTFNEVQLMIGEPQLIRIDGNSKIARFDNNFCQLFLFTNTKIKNDIIKYFEIRNREGKLIINKKKIENCYENFRLI